MIRSAMVIARRDFLAVVATPTFLMFLLAPLFMIGFALIGGTGATQVAASSAKVTRIAAIANEADGAALARADARLRDLYLRDSAPPKLELVPVHGDEKMLAHSLFDSKRLDYAAVLYGPLDQPSILRDAQSVRASAYLATLAEQVLRDRKSGIAPDTQLSRASMVEATPSSTSLRGQQASGYFAVFGIFFLTLLLAGQAVGMLAEEKSNKVIEILAAAVPLEAVFLGKLVGMFGVATLFVSFWATLATIAISFLPNGVMASVFHPAIGLPTFLVLCALYFSMAYMLLGAVFLGIGAQASTMREIQMLSLPITIFQVAMFGLSSAAAASPGSTLALVAEIFPFSSPFAMAGKGASDPALWPHLLALAWQALWVGITIWVAARLFRFGVLKSGSGFRSFFKRKPATV